MQSLFTFTLRLFVLIGQLYQLILKHTLSDLSCSLDGVTRQRHRACCIVMARSSDHLIGHGRVKLGSDISQCATSFNDCLKRALARQKAILCACTFHTPTRYQGSYTIRDSFDTRAMVSRHGFLEQPHRCCHLDVLAKGRCHGSRVKLFRLFIMGQVYARRSSMNCSPSSDGTWYRVPHLKSASTNPEGQS